MRAENIWPKWPNPRIPFVSLLLGIMLTTAACFNLKVGIVEPSPVPTQDTIDTPTRSEPTTTSRSPEPASSPPTELTPKHTEARTTSYPPEPTSTPQAEDATPGVMPDTMQAAPEKTLVPGTWVPAGSLTDGRFRHTATLMSDGRVLIVGGLQERAGGLGLASVEVYDPASGTWSTSGSLDNGRPNHTATLLPDGTVLVTGGGGSPWGPPLDSVEIYNPISGTWTSAPPLSVPRNGHSATRLADGRVLVAGGRFSTRNPDVHASAEIYDPVSGTWSPTGSLTTPRENHSATLLPDGRVLVVNGYYRSWLASAEIYDPVSGAWSPITNPLACHGVAHTATLLPDGRVLVVGGACGGGTPGIIADAEIYDPATSTWTATAALPETRSSHTATLLPDGTVLIAGGDNGGPLQYDSALIYDPASGRWRTAGSLNNRRLQHTATLLPDGTVLAVGGWNDDINYLESAELYLSADN